MTELTEESQVETVAACMTAVLVTVVGLVVLAVGTVIVCAGVDWLRR